MVVDSGLERRASFDIKNGVTRLETRPIAKASATQRAGRAGRLGPGVCYRLWSSEVQERLAEQSPPDILTQELTGLLLDAAQWGPGRRAAAAGHAAGHRRRQRPATAGSPRCHEAGG